MKNHSWRFEKKRYAADELGGVLADVSHPARLILISGPPRTLRKKISTEIYRTSVDRVGPRP